MRNSSVLILLVMVSVWPSCMSCVELQFFCYVGFPWGMDSSPYFSGQRWSVEH